MPEHHSKDYKMSAIKYYQKVNSLRKTCEIFECAKTSLQRWIEKYYETGNLDRKQSSKKAKLTTAGLTKFIKDFIKKYPNVILKELKKKIYKELDIKISKTYLFYIIKYKLNITRKKLRKKYYPGKKDEKKELLEFYKELIKLKRNDIIFIDETSFYLNMTLSYGRNDKGKRVYLKTDKYPFKKYNFICAINRNKVVGYKLYENLKGGLNVEEFNKFFNDNIKGKFKNNTIFIDNAPFHRNKKIKENIEKSGNRLSFCVSYNPKTNPIEGFFNQLKHYVKLESPQEYKPLNKLITKIINKKIKTEHLNNYIDGLYRIAASFIKENAK